MNMQQYWTDKEWYDYYSFLVEEYLKEDIYMSEYLADSEANY